MSNNACPKCKGARLNKEVLAVTIGDKNIYEFTKMSIKEELEREKASTELFAYPGAGHGFIGNDQANSDARTQSKKATLTFFETHL